MTFQGSLRPFQQEALDQLLEWGGRGLLAVVMGGGKTAVSIALTEQLLDEEEVEAGLVIVPPNLKRQWVRNGFEKFAPDANVVLIDGTPKQRREQYARAREWAEYIVLGYSQVVDDWSEVRTLPRDFVIADEVQAIKNFKAKRSRRMKQLGGGIRIGLTGQPLENRPEDVFSICEWIDPEVLGRFDIFDRTFVVRNNWGRPLRYKNLPTLEKRLREQVMVRYSRDDIADMLPEKHEDTYLVDLDAAGKRLYRTIAKDALDALDAAAELGARPFDVHAHYTARDDSSPAELAIRGRIMARLTCLRMLCDHPALLNASAQLYAESQAPDSSLKLGSAYAHELKNRGLLDKRYGSPKFDDTVEMVRDLLSEDESNKIVLFSFFKPVLAWFHEALGETSVLYTGDVSNHDKQAAVDRFNTDPRVRVLLSSDAGGSGVDLPAGSHHINFNLPYSAGQLEQRDARIDRISSLHEHIFIINQLVADTIEERYHDVLLNRRVLARAVVDGKRTKGGKVEFNTKSLRESLEDFVRHN